MPPAAGGQWKPSYDLNNFGSSKVTHDFRAKQGMMPRQGGIRLPVRTAVAGHYEPGGQPTTVSGGMRLPPVSGPGRTGIAAPHSVPPLDPRGSYEGGSPGARDSIAGGVGFGKELLEIIREMREQLAAQQRQISMLTHEVRSGAAAEMRAELQQLKVQRDDDRAPPAADGEVAALRELVSESMTECAELRARVAELEARPIPAASDTARGAGDAVQTTVRSVQTTNSEVRSVPTIKREESAFAPPSPPVAQPDHGAGYGEVDEVDEAPAEAQVQHPCACSTPPLVLTSCVPPVLTPCRSPTILCLVGWPLQDFVLLLVMCSRINHPCIAPSHLHCPHYCNTITRLLRNIRRPARPPFVCRTPYNIGNDDIV